MQLGSINSLHVFEAFQLDWVAERIAHEDGPLLAGLSRVAQHGLENVVDIRRRSKAITYGLPFAQWQHCTEMRHGHGNTVYKPGIGSCEGLAQVKAQLMPEEIKVYPRVGAAPFSAAKNLAVEGSSLVKIAYMIGQMKQCLHGAKLALPEIPCVYLAHMANLSKLTRKVSEYHRVLEQTTAYRKSWDDTLEAEIVAALKQLITESQLSATVEVKEQIANLAAITLSLGNVKSDLSQDVAEGVTRQLIKHNGSLVYQQLFNGKVVVIIQYPFIENYGKPQPPKTVGIYRPEELRPPFFQRHLEDLLTEVTKWEDYDDDEPNQKIGFKFNFEQPDLTETAAIEAKK